MESVTLPHAVLREGATYLLEVLLDPYRGPENLEGGSWLLELFGSGDAEVGADTMEADLEALIVQSWVDKVPDPALPPRKERAEASRKAWLAKKEGNVPEAEVDPAAQEEADKLAKIFERNNYLSHANREASEFVFTNKDEPPMLIAEDPYTITLQPGQEPVDGPEVDSGCRGQAEANANEVSAAVATWEKLHSEIEVAHSTNKEALDQLKEWQKGLPWGVMRCQEQRDQLRGALQNRIEQRAALREVLMDVAADGTKLDESLKAATVAEVGLLDRPLVEDASKKLQLIMTCQELAEGALATHDAEEADAPPADRHFGNAEVRQKVGEALASAVEIQTYLAEKSIPVPESASSVIARVQEALDALAPSG